jgi:multidrug resistance efflux pump
VRASEYAEHLLNVATKFSAAGWTHACGLAMARPSRLEGRLLAVLNERLNRRSVTRSLVLAALVSALCVIIPVAMLRAADDKKTDGATNNSTIAGQKSNASPLSAPEGVTLEIADNGSLSFGGKAVSLDNLMDELAALRRTNPEVNATIRTPPETEHANVLEVLNVLQRAGITSISLVTQAGDPADVSRIRLRQAEKELDRASELHRQKLISQADYEKAQNDVEVRRAELGGNKAEVVRAKLQHAKSELERLTKLHAEKFVSEQELDQARFAVELLNAELAGDSAQTTQAEVEMAKAQLAVAQANLKRTSELVEQKAASQSQSEQAEAEVAAAEARLRLATAQYGRVTAIERAPTAASAPQKPDRRKAEVGNAELQVAQADLNIAKAKLNRVADLVVRKLAAEPELEVAKAEVSKAEAQLRLAMAQYEQVALPKGNAVEKTSPSQLKKERLLQILAEEIQVAEGQARLMRDQYKAGTATFDTSLRAELDVVALKREVARLDGNMEQARDLIGQQIRVLEDLKRDLRDQRNAGVAREADELKLRREILSLKRQQAELE